MPKKINLGYLMIPSDRICVFEKVSIHAKDREKSLATVSKEYKYWGILAKGHLLCLKLRFGEGIHQL